MPQKDKTSLFKPWAKPIRASISSEKEKFDKLLAKALIGGDKNMTLCVDELVRIPKVTRFWGVLCLVTT